jgi:hypothetical protein
VIKLTVEIILAYHTYQLHLKFYSSLFVIISFDVDIIDQILIRLFTLVRHWREKSVRWDSIVYHVFTVSKKAHDRREILYNIVIEFSTFTKLDEIQYV